MNCIPFELPGFRLSAVENREHELLIEAEAQEDASECPGCHGQSSSIHSHYLRKPRDLPSSGKAIRLVLSVRRFRCRNPDCPRKIFCERLPKVVSVSAQRTARLLAALQGLGWALGGEAGSRQSRQLGMSVSSSSLLRYLRGHPLPPRPIPRILGVDDFALRKGRVYGTLFVDGESHRPVDLVLGRTSDALADWLHTHPGVELITRDRSTEYARGASQGAPVATQIADRWHLLTNWREALERVLDRVRVQIYLDPSQEPTALSPYERSRRRGTRDQMQQQASRARRYALYAQVKSLHAQGRNISQIARQLKMNWSTVRKYIASEIFPESSSARQKSMLDPYVHYLQMRWDQGCRESQQLWREIQAQGYPGSIRMVWLWVALRRPPQQRGRSPVRQVEVFIPPNSSPAVDPLVASLPASRRLVWLLIQPMDKLDDPQQLLRQRLLQLSDLQIAFELTQRFLSLIRQREVDALQPWLEDCLASGISELVSFALGLQQELPVIRAALEFPYSNGVTEGHVNRLKTIKRSMYGRANFDLLRLRVLHPT